MRNTFVAVVVFSLMLCASAHAAENWTPRLSGLYEGLASGALPPKGVYVVNTTMTSKSTFHDQNGHHVPLHSNVFVDVPAVLWVPGVKVLNADYAFAIAQPFNWLKTSVDMTAPTYDVARWGLYNTYVVPVELSWSLPNNFRLLAGLGVYAPTGTFRRPTYAGGNYRGFSNSIGFWATEPTVAVSWFYGTWSVNAHLSYNYNFENPRTEYTTGQIVQGDYSVTNRIGAWTVGVGGYTLTQITDDQSKYPSQQAVIHAAKGNRATAYAVGPIVGYDFGKFSVTAFFNETFGAKNTCSGPTYWTRLVIPFSL